MSLKSPDSKTDIPLISEDMKQNIILFLLVLLVTCLVWITESPYLKSYSNHWVVTISLILVAFSTFLVKNLLHIVVIALTVGLFAIAAILFSMLKNSYATYACWIMVVASALPPLWIFYSAKKSGQEYDKKALAATGVSSLILFIVIVLTMYDYF